MNYLPAATLIFLMSGVTCHAAPQTIHPGEAWPDDRGKHVQAHGGGITKVGDTYYWFGEDRSQDNPPGMRYVACYASKDLAHWQFRKQVVALADPENLGGTDGHWVLERPKVFYNAKTKKYVMYVHLDGRGGYKFASVGVLTCDQPDGSYQYVRSFRPLGKESRDIGQFVDDDGSAYLIFECRPEKGFCIAKLSEDYLDVEKEVCMVHAPLEGGAVVHYNGLYYAIGLRADWLASQPQQIRDCDLAGRAVVGVQGHRAAGNEHVWFAVHADAESHRHQGDHGDLHGRPLAARDAVGFALSVDAAANRRRPACVARAETVDPGYPDRRSGHPTLSCVATTPVESGC